MSHDEAASPHTTLKPEHKAGHHLLEAPSVVSAGGVWHQCSRDGLLLLLQDAADVAQEREAVLQTIVRTHNKCTTACWPAPSDSWRAMELSCDSSAPAAIHAMKGMLRWGPNSH